VSNFLSTLTCNSIGLDGKLRYKENGAGSMRIQLNLYASLASHLPEKATGNACTIEVPEGAAVKDILGQLKIRLELPKIIFLNGIHASLDDVVKNGDRLAVFPPIAGG
jgi:molybdopterin synthase sulfur carrier subunit